jgi:peroxiredoxin
LPDNAGQLHSLQEFQGRPVVLIFFLGNGCLHCAEQLHAFAKAKQAFDDAGIALFAISSDDREGLKRSIDNYKVGPLPVPLVSDPDQSAFKAYRAFDDFENVPLHGTFLLDGAGLVRWQDIGPEPFMDHRFLLTEAKRLLAKRDSRPPLRTISSQE